MKDTSSDYEELGALEKGVGSGNKGSQSGGWAEAGSVSRWPPACKGVENVA